MATDKRLLKVFLCHAHADRDPVRALYTRLTKDGVDAWLDKEKLLPGQDWELEIRKAVRESDVVVVCLSKQFNQAGFRQKEVRLALDTAMEQPEGEIFIIPARLEECDNLESLRRWHWVDLFEEDGYEMLTRAIRTRANDISIDLQIQPKNGSENLSKRRIQAWLVDKNANKSYQLFSAETTIGRASTNDIVLTADRTISRVSLRITVINGHFYLYPISNTTKFPRINGRFLRERRFLLTSDDEIQIGEHTTFMFVSKYEHAG